MSFLPPTVELGFFEFTVLVIFALLGAGTYSVLVISKLFGPLIARILPDQEDKP